VYIGSTPYDGPAGTDRHMVDHLSRRGPVLFVNPPVSVLAHVARHGLPSSRPRTAVRVLHPGLAVATPLVTPGFTRRGLHRATAPMMRRAIRSAVRRLFLDAAHDTHVRGIVSCRVEPLFDAVPARRRVFYATDDLAAGADLLGIPEGRLRRQTAAVMASADAIAVVSPTLAAQVRAQGYSPELVPNGCDPQAYASVDELPRAADVPLSGPVAGFVGHINDRIDLSLLEAVADTGTALLLVGPRSDSHQTARLDALVARPTVTWVGSRPFAALPAYMRAMDVGLTPYADTAFNRASFPLKTLDYLAAGRRVVATPLPAHDWLETDLIDLAAEPRAFADSVLRALASERPATETERRRAFARQHSWANRAAALSDLVAPSGQGRPS
jgi:teichuronic acid biosynthesis glycosyltransferase TuaH